MSDWFRFSRRVFLVRSGTAGIGVASAAGLGLFPRHVWASETSPDVASLVAGIKDKEILAGVEAAIAKNLLPAATEHHYPGLPAPRSTVSMPLSWCESSSAIEGSFSANLGCL